MPEGGSPPAWPRSVVPHRVGWTGGGCRRATGAANGSHVVGASDFPAPIRQLMLELATPLVVEATVDDDELDRFLSGTVPPATVRSAALAGAWRLVERDGLDVAEVVVHAALDLFSLAREEPSLGERAEAWQRLEGMRGAARDRLAERLRV